MSEPDALMLASFGGPEGPADVLPFLENVTRGRNIPPERLVRVGAHYDLFDGVSPINAANRALLASLETELVGAGIDLPLYWGNRHWHPLLPDTFTEMKAAGHRHVFAMVTSAFGSPSGCRAYSHDLELAATASGIEVTKSRLYWNHPRFMDAVAVGIEDALQAMGPGSVSRRLVFTAHSVPSAWQETAPYVNQLNAACRHLAQRCAPELELDLVYQSRSGPPNVAWLEPDVNDHLRHLAETGWDSALVVPVGFVSDHMEVVYDLDTQARATADDVGITMARAATPGTHPAFATMLRELVEEQLRQRPPLAAVAEPYPNPCPATCCPSGG